MVPLVFTAPILALHQMTPVQDPDAEYIITVNGYFIEDTLRRLEGKLHITPHTQET